MPFGQIGGTIFGAIKRIPFVPSGNMHVHVIGGHPCRGKRAKRRVINAEPESSRRLGLRFDPKRTYSRLAVVMNFHDSSCFGVVGLLHFTNFTFTGGPPPTPQPTPHASGQTLGCHGCPMGSFGMVRFGSGVLCGSLTHVLGYVTDQIAVYAELLRALTL